jgi:hypothetical protein
MYTKTKDLINYSSKVMTLLMEDANDQTEGRYLPMMNYTCIDVNPMRKNKD